MEYSTNFTNLTLLNQAKNLSQRDIENAFPMTFTGPLAVGDPNVTSHSVAPRSPSRLRFW
jgi:hypothetical protein